MWLWAYMNLFIVFSIPPPARHTISDNTLANFQLYVVTKDACTLRWKNEIVQQKNFKNSYKIITKN